MKYPEQKPGPRLAKLIENGDAYINIFNDVMPFTFTELRPTA